MYVVITCMGRGECWKFDSFTAADEHPLFQYGDAICHDGSSVARQFNQLELPGLATRLGDTALARTMEKELASCGAGRSKKELLHYYGELLWKKIQVAAKPPPGDPKIVCDQITRDRRRTKQLEFIMAKAKKVENAVDGAEAAEKPAKAPKAPKAPKEPKTSGRTSLDDSFVIRLQSDKDGKQYGADNNPKRAGTKAHERFASYKDGMTVKEAVEAGLKRDDISWDVRHGFLALEKGEAAPVAEQPAEQPAETAAAAE